MKKHGMSFGHILKASFIDRPNRFLVRCCAYDDEVIEAFLPNPGRLWELLIPGATLYLTGMAKPTRKSASHRKTQHTALAAEREGAVIFLHTNLTNWVARLLIDQKRIPCLKDAEIVQTEVPLGRSRFDFLLRENGQEVYMEVKSCTLFGNGVAMFPDAVTERGRRHLLELAALSQSGRPPIVLLLVHSLDVRWFMPDYHTDLAFSQALMKVRRDLRILPVAIGWTPTLSLKRSVKILEIPWDYLQQEITDRGSYLLMMKLETDKRISVGKLGMHVFQKGHYVYVGSAMRNLSARIARHKKIRKKARWHVDYLRQEVEGFLALPIRSSQREECEVARAFSLILQPGPAGFGSSDCTCPTHLFQTTGDPLHSRSFHKVLQQFRMRLPP